MSCDEIRPLLEAYALGVLEDDEATQVDEHLDRCDACRRLADEYAAAAHSLPEALAAVSRLRPSTDLKARLLRAVESDAAATPVPRLATRGRSGRARRPMGRLGVLAFAVVLALAITSTALLGVARGRERDLRAKLAGLTGKQQIVLDVVDSPKTTRGVLRPPNPASTAYGKIFTNPEFRTVVFMAARLPRPPDGRAYHVWLTSGTRHRMVGALKVNAEGFGLLVFDAGHRGPSYDAAQIFLGPEDSRARTGRLVLQWRRGSP